MSTMPRWKCPDCVYSIDTDLDDAVEAISEHRISHAMERDKTRRICKVEGCIQTAVDKTGLYANLCATHKGEATAKRRSEKNGSVITTAVATDVSDSERLGQIVTQIDDLRAEAYLLLERMREQIR